LLKHDHSTTPSVAILIGMDAFKTIMETYDSLNVTFEITLYSSKREVISASTIYSHMSLNTQFLSINIS
ncbi:hypothetical protein MKD01_15330, partial [[Clostridium] innocuum]|nr:hypothetical protein [[Clostridium] innocuum]